VDEDDEEVTIPMVTMCVHGLFPTVSVVKWTCGVAGVDLALAAGYVLRGRVGILCLPILPSLGIFQTLAQPGTCPALWAESVPSA